MQYYPLPQWTVAEQADPYAVNWWRRAEDYFTSDQSDQSLGEKVRGEGLGLHWDFMKFYGRSIQKTDRPWWSSEAQFSFITKQNLEELASGNLLRDPFAEGYLFGYVATEGDFMLISQGPDEDSDVLPFLQSAGGGFEDLSTTSTLTVDWAILRAKTALYNAPPSERGNSLVPPVGAFYDPTNGIVSDGDVVLHRWGSGNFLLQVDPKGLLTDERLKPNKRGALCGPGIEP
jgi:hypothetical protein